MAAEIIKVKYLPELRAVANLADEIWHECFPGIISEGQIDYMVNKFQSLEAMIKQIEEQKYSYFAVRENGDLCGYFAVKPEEDSRLFLSKLYLRLDRRGRGLATDMLRRVFEEERRYGNKSVYLTVNKYNDRAIDIYIHSGFKVIDETVTDIGEGYVMDDFIMEYVL